MLEMLLKNSFIDQTNLLRNGAQFEKPTLNLNRSINCPPLRQPLVANSCDDFFRMVMKLRRFRRLLWMTSNRHRLSSRRGYHYFRMFQFGFWVEHCVSRAWMSLRVYATMSKQTSSLTATAYRWVMIALLFKLLSRWRRTKSHRSGCSQ
jgi:hypothetical protein